MEDISSVLAAFNTQGVTEQYYITLQQQRNGVLSNKERQTLEGKIREYRRVDRDTVLGAIVIYEILCPGEAVRYARQKGVFHYGNSWPHIVYCLENLNTLAGTLRLPASEQRYLQQKLKCLWLIQFYKEIEEKLRRDICKHYKSRICKQIDNQWVESNFIVEMLAFINLSFRYGVRDSTKYPRENIVDKGNIENYSTEEISEAVSYLIYLFTDEKGLKASKTLWLDINYVLSDDIKRIILLACQRNLIMEWESLVDCLGYEIETDGKNVSIYSINGHLEKSLRIGFVKTLLQGQLFLIRDLAEEQIGLQELAKKLVTEFGDYLFEWRCEDKLLQRYRMKFPAPLLEPLHPKGEGPLELFREEYAEINFAVHELTFNNANIFDRMVTDHCSVVDLILFKRFFILSDFAQRWLFEKEGDLRKVIPSLVPVMTEDLLISILEKFVQGKEKASELLNLLSWDGQGRLDLQYTPILKLDKKHYYIATDILISSNIVRNSLVLARSKGNLNANSDGQADPLERLCKESFQDCSYSYGTRSSVKFTYGNEAGEIDFLAWSDSRLYVIECKNAILPASAHEIRATYEHIQNATRQLDMSSRALMDKGFQKTYFSSWGISEKKRTIHTCILMGNRLFSVPNGLKHPVRYAYELNMILTSGTVNSNLGRWSCWGDKQFSDDDLARYLSDADPLSRSFIDAMKPYAESFRCRGKWIQLHSYFYNSLLHLEKQDEYLRSIEKNIEVRQALKKQLCAKVQNDRSAK